MFGALYFLTYHTVTDLPPPPHPTTSVRCVTLEVERTGLAATITPRDNRAVPDWTHRAIQRTRLTIYLPCGTVIPDGTGACRRHIACA